jgi:biopolymer transport protein ExbB
MKNKTLQSKISFTTLTLALVPAIASAQDAAAEAAAEPTGVAWALQQMNDGGIFMWFIFIGLVLLILLAGERFAALYGKLGAKGDQLYTSIAERIQANDINGAKEVAASASGSALGTVLAAALDHAGQPERVIQDAVDEADLAVNPKITARTGYLSTIANVSTLMGLLGTIIGLIQAFASLAQADPSQKQVALANGISIAMNTTAFGLIVAIPGMVLFAILMSRTNKLIEDIDLYSMKTVNLLASKK